MHRNPLNWLTDRSTSPRGRWLVLAVWLIAAALLGTVAPKLATIYDNRASQSIGDQESVRAATLVQREFPQQNGVPAIIVLSDSHGLTVQDTKTSQQISCWLVSEQQRAQLACPTTFTYPQRPANIGAVISPTVVPQASSQLISADNTTMTIITTIAVPNGDSLHLQQNINAIRAYTDTLQSAGLQVKVTGPGGILADLVEIFASTDVKLLLTTVLLVLVLLIVIYRSPLLALLPLIGVGWALTIVQGILGFAGQAHLFPISQQATAIMDVLLFGAGTDYTIFIVARYREELLREPDRVLALQATMRGVGEAITSSAGTVIVTLLTLTLAILGLYSSLGLVMAIAVVVMLLAGLTLIPALLSVLGRAAFWPFIPKTLTAEALHHQETQPAKGFWSILARFVARRPWFAVISSTIVLTVLAFGYLGVPEVYNSLTDLKKPTPATEGYAILARHFAPGTLAPFTVVVHFTQGGDAYSELVALDQITQAVAQAPHVARVTGPTRPDGNPPTIAPATLQQDFAQLPPNLTAALRSGQGNANGGTGNGGPPGGSSDPRIIGLYAATIPTVSDDHSTVLLQVTLDTDPYSIPALDAMKPIRAAAQHAATQAGLPESAVTLQLTGVTPQLADTRTVSDRDTMLVVPLVLVLVAIILGILLRSLVAPLYLLAAVTLNFFAALGATAFIMTHFTGDEGMAYATPLYTFIFLVALGADYTIFLMSRVREEAAKRGLIEGTQVALSRTGGVITSAGLILAGTFLVLTTLPLRTLSSFGIAVALGVLLDTFLVRGLLVPGMVIILGRANWWPGKLTSPEAKSM